MHPYAGFAISRPGRHVVGVVVVVIVVFGARRHSALSLFRVFFFFFSFFPSSRRAILMLQRIARTCRAVKYRARARGFKPRCLIRIIIKCSVQLTVLSSLTVLRRPPKNNRHGNLRAANEQRAFLIVSVVCLLKKHAGFSV